MYKYNILILASFFIACSDQKRNQIVYDIAKTDKIVKIDKSDEHSPQCHVALSLNYATEEGGKQRAKKINEAIGQKLLNLKIPKMQDAVDSFANQYARDYLEHYAPLYQEDRRDAGKRSWYEYHYVIDTEVQAGREGVSVYLSTIDYYEGGAHGINQKLAFNFDNLTGRQYTLNDVFVSGYQQQLNTILLKALMEKKEVSTVHELKEKGYLYSMDMFATQNFILNEETITFIYNPYDIAPYSEGKTELVIAYSTLKDILKKN